MIRPPPPAVRGRPRFGQAGAVVLLLALLAVGCDRDDSPHTGGRLDIAASIILVDGLDEEGGTVARVLPADSAPAAFFRDGVLFVDPRIVVEYLSAGASVGVVEGKLRLDGSDTGLAVELRDGGSYAALGPLADRFQAYARAEESPGRMVTLWRHDVLCQYAAGADRRAELFLEAAEQGLLRDCEPPLHVQVRRWTDARSDERWAASVRLREPLDSTNVLALLERYRARPYAVYSVTAGHHLVVRVPAEEASLQTLSMLRAATLEALVHARCGLSAAVERGRRVVIRRSGAGVDSFHGERHMLASALATRDELARVRSGGVLVFGADVVASSADLQRLATDPRVERFDPASRLDDMWAVPGVDLSAAPGVTIPLDVAALDSIALFDRLATEAAGAAAVCPRHDARY
jgi:hypothetical protein